jgi:protein-disulfide isomerase
MRRVNLKQTVRGQTRWITIGAVAVLVVAGLVGWGIHQTRKPDAFATPAGVADGGGVSAGEGPVTVDVYLDFLCPACTTFYAKATGALDQMVADGKIRLVWHPLGLQDQASSPAGYSTRAASSAGCASDAGRLKPYAGALLAQQPLKGGAGLSDDQLIEIAGYAGIIAPSFAQCVRTMKYRDWVAHLTDLATRSGVNQTPAVLVAGKKIDDPSVANIQAAVASAG